MKRLSPLAIVLAAGLAVLSATPAVSAPGGTRATTYDVTAETIEGCSCPLFCPCYFGPSADEHMCQFNNVYKFRPGSHYGDVDISDQLVWMSGDLGGEWHKKPGPGMPTNWTVVTYDRRSTPAQRAAILKVVNTVFNVTWGKMSTREDSITWQDDPMKAHATMASGLAEITLDKASTLRPDAATPAIIKNLQYWFSTSNDGFVLAYSTHKFNGDTKYAYEKKNGFTITWSAKGEVKPPAGAAGMR